MDPLLAKFQRDLNLSGDADRSTRTRALKKLHDALFSARSSDFDGAGDRSRFLSQALMPRLLVALEDAVEKNRELALDIITQLIKDDKNGTATEACALEASVIATLSGEIFRVGEVRLCDNPILESSEELRFAWSELICTLIIHPNARESLDRDLAKVARILSKQCADNFPDNKKQCAKGCILLCEQFPSSVHFHFEALLVGVLTNMDHQHAKVRQSSLAAVQALVLVGAATSSTFDDLMQGKIIPSIRGVNHDRASAVRIQGTQLVSELILRMPDSQKYLKDLLPILLFGLADSTLAIQKMTLDIIEKVGKQLITEGNDGAQGDDQEMADAHAGSVLATPPFPVSQEQLHFDPEQLPEPFTGRPGPHARLLVSRTLPLALPALLRDAVDWTAQERFRAVALLRCMIVFAEGKVAPFVGAILDTIYVVCMDEEENVRNAAMDCARLLGHYCNSEQLLDLLLPSCVAGASARVQQQAGSGVQDNAAAKLGALETLSGAIFGFKGGNALASHLARVSRALCAPAIAQSEGADVQVTILHVAQSVLARFLGEKEAIEGREGADTVVVALDLDSATACSLLRVLLPMAATGTEDPIVLLAACAGFYDANAVPDVQALAEKCCGALLKAILTQKYEFPDGCCDTVAINDNNTKAMAADSGSTNALPSCRQWTKYAPERQLFDQIVRRTGARGLARVGQLKVVVGVMLETCGVERDADLRLCMLSLLETLIAERAGESNKTANPLDKFLEPLVEDVLLPSLVWRVGRVASTIRKVSMFCFGHLVGSSNSATQAKWFEREAAKLVPTLKACLDDMDADTRRYTCVALRNLFGLLANNNTKVPYIMVSDIYHDVVKRLDDADDNVRVVSCGVLVNLLKVSPNEFKRARTPADYIMDAAFIHLDDPKSEVQQAVFQVVETIITVEGMDREALRAKAVSHRARHRSPDYCDKIIAALS